MRFFTVLGFALALAVGAHADLYNNLDAATVATNPNFVIGNDTTPCLDPNLPCIPLYNSFTTAGVSQVMTGVTLALAPTGVTADPVQVTLYRDQGGFQTYNDGDPINLDPGFSVSLGAIPDGNVTTGGPGFYSLTNLNVTLDASTRYWIGLSGIGTVAWINGDVDESGATGVTGNYSAYGDTTSAGGSFVASNADFQPFEMAITTGVPEPSTFFPLIGLAGLAFARLRRRR